MLFILRTTKTPSNIWIFAYQQSFVIYNPRKNKPMSSMMAMIPKDFIFSNNDFETINVYFSTIGLFNPYLRIYWQRRIRVTFSARNSKKIAWGHLFWIWCQVGSPRSALSTDAHVGVEQPYKSKLPKLWWKLY